MFNRKEYMREYQKKYRETHRDEIREIMREYRKKNKDKITEYRKKYNEANREKLNARQRKYYANNKDKYKKCILKRCERDGTTPTEIVLNSKKRRVDRLVAEGVINPWSVINRGAAPKYEAKK